MKRTLIFGMIAAVVVMVISFSFLKENRAYNKVIKENKVSMCDDYINQFPKGKHLEEVRYHKIQLSETPFEAINEYLRYYPSGKYADSLNEQCDKLWDEEISKYESRDKSCESAEAVKFMSDLLLYMKKHRINSIQIGVSSHLEIKDYDEYDDDVKTFVEKQLNDTMRLSFKDGMIPLKSNFSKAKVSSLKKIMSEGMQNNLDKMFAPGFITVECVSDDESVNDREMPRLQIDYTIKNQETNVGAHNVPLLWIVNSENGSVRNYLVGITITFNAKCSLPGKSTSSYDYSEIGKPENYIQYIDDIRDSYRRMTSMCFECFSDNLCRNMGLQKTCSQSEEGR